MAFTLSPCDIDIMQRMGSRLYHVQPICRKCVRLSCLSCLSKPVSLLTCTLFLIQLNNTHLLNPMFGVHFFNSIKYFSFGNPEVGYSYAIGLSLCTGSCGTGIVSCNNYMTTLLQCVRRLFYRQLVAQSCPANWQLSSVGVVAQAK